MKMFMYASLSLCLLAIGCKKEDTNSVNNGTGRISLVKGGNQSGVFGELLKDTITLKITSSNNKDHFKISYSLLQGNGRVEQNGYTYTAPLILDSAGTINVTWRMGCDNNVQKLVFYVYTDSLNNGNFYNSPSDSIVVTASAVKPNGWCRACGYFGNVDAYTSKIISHDNSTLYLINYGLYSSVDGGLNWYKVNGVPNENEIVDAAFNSQGWLYLLTKMHGIYFSKDMHNWTAINNGILDMRDPTAFYVDDSTLFVSFYFDGPYRTTDNGGLWKKLLVGGGSQRFYLFNRHPNGSIMLFDDWNDLKVSTDNGDTWSVVNIDYKYKQYKVYDFKIDAQGLLYIGADEASISVLDPGTYQGTVHSNYQWNASTQPVNNITLAGNDVYYLENASTVPGIYSKSNNWSLIDIGFTNPINYFYLKQNGAFVIGSQGWLYYNH